MVLVVRAIDLIIVGLIFAVCGAWAWFKMWRALRKVAKEQEDDAIRLAKIRRRLAGKLEDRSILES